eukprot:1136681-Pelagomonas_calceolata.AAC.9
MGQQHKGESKTKAEEVLQEVRMDKMAEKYVIDPAQHEGLSKPSGLCQKSTTLLIFSTSFATQIFPQIGVQEGLALLSHTGQYIPEPNCAEGNGSGGTLMKHQFQEDTGVTYL